jgi:hypothetical protein
MQLTAPCGMRSSSSSSSSSSMFQPRRRSSCWSAPRGAVLGGSGDKRGGASPDLARPAQHESHCAVGSLARGAVVSPIGSLYSAEEARTHLEHRYLERAPTLSSDLAADWQALGEQAERLAGLGDVVDPTAARADRARRRRSQSSRRAEIDMRQLRATALDGALPECRFSPRQSGRGPGRRTVRAGAEARRRRPRR